MRKLAVSVCLALWVASAPLTVMAQAAPLDEETRATVVMVAQRTAAAVGGPAAPLLASELPGEAQPAPIPDTGDPEPEPTDPEPTGEPVALPELNLTDLVEYSSQGVTFRAPADWTVETDISDDTPFFIEVPGTELFISMEADAALDFPSWLGMTLFRSEAALLLSEFGESAELVESATLYTDQDLPVIKLEFIGIEDDEELAGVMYVTAPNETAYVIVGGGTPEEWGYAAPGVELIAESVTFSEELIVVARAGDEPMLFEEEETGVSVTVPAGWYVMPTSDTQFPVLASEPEVRYVVAISTAEAFGSAFDPEILDVFAPGGELDPSRADGLIEELSAMLAGAGTPFILDEEVSSVIPRDGAVTVKLIGNAELGDGISMPILFYIDLREVGVGVVAIFGDTATALEIEEELQTMVESVAVPE